MDFQGFINDPNVQAAGAAVATLALPYMYNKLSGQMDIGRYLGDIHRAAFDYASQMGLDAEGIRSKPLDLSNVNSLFVANSESAAMTLVIDGKPQRHAVRLGNKAGQVILLQVRGQLDRPREVFSILGQQINCKKVPRDLQRESASAHRIWTRPTRWNWFWALLARDAAYEDRAERIRAPLDYMAKVLAASPEPSVELSGGCHIALKVPDSSTGRADIIVMPTTRREADLMTAIEKHHISLPEGQRTAETLRAALVKHYVPDLARLNGAATRPGCP